MTEEFSGLHVGDRIRILGVPGKDVAGYKLHPDARALYEWLVAEQIVVRIYEIDEWGAPWARCPGRSSPCDEYLAISDYDIWERVADEA